MRAQRFTQVAFVLAFGVLLARLVVAPLPQNLAQVIAINAFSSRFASSRSVELLQSALSFSCSGNKDCGLEAIDSEKSVLEIARDQFIPDPTPMQIISDSVRIPSDQLVPSGSHGSLQDIDAPGVMYGPGTLKLRPFLISEQERCWQIAVKAKHDDPPPVNLDIWLDRDKAGTLSYDRGDQSWEVLSINVPAGPNLHILGITFANDFLDNGTGADRNAYIEYIEITPQEDSLCKDD